MHCRRNSPAQLKINAISVNFNNILINHDKRTVQKDLSRFVPIQTKKPSGTYAFACSFIGLIIDVSNKN